MDEIQRQPMQESVQLRFTHSEQEYLAAVRLYFRHSTEMMTRLVMIFVMLVLIFRGILRRNLHRNLKLTDDEHENKYISTSSQPPDWR